MVGRATVSKPEIQRRLKGFDKESHAKSLAGGIMRIAKAGGNVDDAINKANAVVKAVREAKVSSFYAAEYAKVFDDPEKALSTRERLIAEYELEHGLTTKRAKKMADCVVFSVAKKPSEANLERMAKAAHKMLAMGVEFTVAADVVYYNSPEADPGRLARRCVETSMKQNKPADFSEAELGRALADGAPVPESSARRESMEEVRGVVDALSEFS
jgi:hypothetical protein